MTEQVRKMFYALCSTDPTINPENIPTALAVLAGNGGEEERILSRAEVAKMLGCTIRSVDNYCKRGFFRKVNFGASRRGNGILASSVVAGMQEGAALYERKAKKRATV